MPSVTLTNVRGQSATATSLPELNHLLRRGFTPDSGSATAAAAQFDPSVATQGQALEQYTSDALKAALRRGERSRRFPGQSAQKPLTTFGAGHGFTVTGAWTSTNLNDTSDAGWDSQVVSAVTPGTGAGCNLTNGALGAAFDPTGKHVAVLMKAADPSKVGSVTLYFGDTGTGFTNSQQYFLTTVPGMAGALPGEWTLLTGSVASGSPTGTGPGTAALAVKIRVADVAGQPGTTVAFGGVALLTPSAKYPNGVVSFTFDDAFASHYTVARPLLNRYRYRATAYPILSKIGQGGALTLAQTLALEAVDGWEVGAHASTSAIHDAGLDTLTGADVETEMQALRGFALDNGLRGDSLAYPLGRYNATVVAAARRYFATARSTQGTYEVTPPADFLRMRTKQVAASDTAAALTAMVDAAYANKHHLVFTIHDVVASGAAGAYQMNSATLATLVDYCATKGIPVLPVAEAVAAY